MVATLTNNVEKLKLPMFRGQLPAREACAACPLANANGGPTQPVLGIGPAAPRFVCLGEGPGTNEVRIGMPFVGQSGQLLMRALRQSRVEREDVWFTNVTLCKPPIGGNKDSLVAKAAKSCRNRLIAELKNLPPSVPILALGKYAAQAFLGDEFKITELAGSYHEVEVEGLGPKRIIPTIHPAAILRGGAGEGNSTAHATDLLYWNLIYDVGKVNRLALGKQEPFSMDIDIAAKDTKRAAYLVESLAREARRCGYVAIDTETIGVEPEECEHCLNCRGHRATEPMHARLVAVGFATEKRAISVSWQILHKTTQQIIARLLADAAVTKIFHNRLYDEVVFERHGMSVIGKSDCTMLMHHNSFPGLNHKLQRVVTQFFLIQPWKAEFRHGKGSVEELLTYNSQDTLTTARVRSVLQVCIERTGAEKTYAIDSRMAEIAKRMQLWGIPIDLNVNRHLSEHFTPAIQRVAKSLSERITDEDVRSRFLDTLAVEKAKRKRNSDSNDFMIRHATRMEEVQNEWDELNLNAGDQVVAFLKACGVPLVQVTEKGKTSTRKDVLEALSGNPIVRDLLNYRTMEKLNSTFVTSMPELVDRDARLHAVWGVNMITGRWNSKINCQNWSKGKNVLWDDGEKHIFTNWLKKPFEKRGLPNLRWQVVAPKGRMLVGADFGQLEARIIALLSGEPYLVKAFMEGVDIHAEFAKEIFPEFGQLAPKSDPWKIRRDHTKRAEYGYLYGGAPATVWKQAFLKEGYDVPLKRVLEMFRVFKQRMPRVEQWHMSLFREVMQKNEIRSFLLGRRRAFPTGNADPTIIKNFPIQSSAADIMNTGLDRFYSAMAKDVKILIQGHDSLVVECDEKNTEKTKALLVKSLESEFTVNGTTIKFPVEADVGKSWAEV